MFIPYWHFPEGGISVVLKAPGAAERFVRPLKDAVAQVDKDIPVARIAPMAQLLATSIERPRYLALLVVLFAGLAAVLSAVGILGVMSYLVAQRTSEIAVRIALGAQRSEVLKLVLRQGMLLAFGGVCAGFLGSLALARVLTTHLYGITSTDPSTFLSISALALLVALLACLRPAYRATKVDPIIALRYE